MIAARDHHLQMSDQLLDLHIAHLRAGGKSQRTIESRVNVLSRLNDQLPFGLVYAATEQIEAWLSDLRTLGRSRWTLSVYAYHIRAFYQWASTSGFLHGDPTTSIARPKAPRCVPKPVTEEVFARVLQLPEPLATAAALAGYAGLRVSEIAACRREHISTETVVIPEGKGGETGVVPTHPYLWALLASRPAGLLVTNRRGSPVDGHWITQTVRYHLDRMGLQGVHLHRLRHRYGTLIQATVGDLRVTQECLRHRNVASTAGYTLVTGDARRAAVASLPVPTGARAGL